MFILTDLDSFKCKSGRYLHDSGYSELANVFQVVAPFEALNCPVENYRWFRALNVDIASESFDWMHILCILLGADYKPALNFVKEYHRVQLHPEEWNVNEAKRIPIDPYPEVFMAELCAQIDQSKWVPNVDELKNVPTYLKKLVREILDFRTEFASSASDSTSATVLTSTPSSALTSSPSSPIPAQKVWWLNIIHGMIIIYPPYPTYFNRLQLIACLERGAKLVKLEDVSRWEPVKAKIQEIVKGTAQSYRVIAERKFDIEDDNGASPYENDIE